MIFFGWFKIPENRTIDQIIGRWIVGIYNFSDCTAKFGFVRLARVNLDEKMQTGLMVVACQTP